MTKEKNFISAVVYVHNAEEHIREFLRNIIGLLRDNFEHSEIICVNDFSTDDSVKKIKEIANEASPVVLSVLNMSYFHGVEVAMNAGVDLSIGDFVLEIDSTLQDYKTEEIMNVYRKVLEGYDIVSAVPNKRKKFSSKLFYWAYEKFSDDGKKLCTESFRVLSRRAINRVGQMSKTVPYRKGLYSNCGLKTHHIQYECVDCLNKKTAKKPKKYRNRLALDTLLLFTNVGFVFSKLMTTLMMIVSVAMAAYTILVFTLGQPVAGWTTTILFLSIAFLSLFAILTIIVKYLQMLVDLTFKRTKYSFEDIQKLTK